MLLPSACTLPCSEGLLRSAASARSVFISTSFTVYTCICCDICLSQTWCFSLKFATAIHRNQQFHPTQPYNWAGINKAPRAQAFWLKQCCITAISGHGMLLVQQALLTHSACRISRTPIPPQQCGWGLALAVCRQSRRNATGSSINREQWEGEMGSNR